ncbi:MAG: hypothetical protein EOO77_28355 [Oxalobacteraceae bacterium]|nr:MAG: hypothetical protein EOO77_28355 [Oxalobacteraceae bacterium]
MDQALERGGTPLVTASREHVYICGKVRPLTLPFCGRRRRLVAESRTDYRQPAFFARLLRRHEPNV